MNRNYDKETKKLNTELANLELDRTYKKLQLQQILKERREDTQERKSAVGLKDKVREKILIGDRVKTLTSGKPIRAEGRVVQPKSWVIFEDVSGVNQVRSSHNLLVCNYDGERDA